MTVNCIVCNKPFSIKPWRFGKAMFCSHQCRGRTMIGVEPWNKGKKMSDESRRKMSDNNWLRKTKKENHPMWSGGVVENRGYICIRVNKKYIREHRLVMENHLGRKLNKNEVVHHINGNIKDNRIENLEILSPHQHAIIHSINLVEYNKTHKPYVYKDIDLDELSKLRNEGWLLKDLASYYQVSIRTINERIRLLRLRKNDLNSIE